MPVERRAYIENVAAQEAAYWYCREHGIRANDFDIGQILQVAGPIILQGGVDHMRESRIARARGLAQAIAECRDDARLDGIREGAAEIVRLLGGQ